MCKQKNKSETITQEILIWTYAVSNLLAYDNPRWDDILIIFESSWTWEQLYIPHTRAPELELRHEMQFSVISQNTPFLEVGVLHLGRGYGWYILSPLESTNDSNNDMNIYMCKMPSFSSSLYSVLIQYLCDCMSDFLFLYKPVWKTFSRIFVLN